METPGDKALSQAVLARAMCRAVEFEGNVERLAEIFEHHRELQMLSYQIGYGYMPVEGYLLAAPCDKARQTVRDTL